jgi:hypothetical protein
MIDTAVLLELREVNAKLDRLAARLDAATPTPWPERLGTTEAVLYIRQAHRRPKFAASTLYRWLSEGRLSDFAHPRHWDRNELDRCCAGTLVSTEHRGARRSM